MDNRYYSSLNCVSFIEMLRIHKIKYNFYKDGEVPVLYLKKLFFKDGMLRIPLENSEGMKIQVSFYEQDNSFESVDLSLNSFKATIRGSTLSAICKEENVCLIIEEHGCDPGDSFETCLDLGYLKK